MNDIHEPCTASSRHYFSAINPAKLWLRQEHCTLVLPNPAAMIEFKISSSDHSFISESPYQSGTPARLLRPGRYLMRFNDEAVSGENFVWFPVPVRLFLRTFDVVATR
jgi:hypothetical protein